MHDYHIYGVSKSVTFIPGLLLTHTLKICTGTYDGEGMKLGIIHWSTTVHVQDRVQSTVKSISLFGEAPNAVHYIYGGENNHQSFTTIGCADLYPAPHC